MDLHGYENFINFKGLFIARDIYILETNPDDCNYKKSAVVCTDSTIYNAYGTIPSTFVPRGEDITFRLELFRDILVVT
jgi:hypothetical protein